MKLSQEQFVASLGGRNKTLAEGLLDGTPAGDYLAKGFSPTIITEMGHKIRRKVEGMEDFVFSFDVAEEVMTSEPTNEDDAKILGIATGVKKNHITRSYTNAPLEGGCCEG